MSKFTCEKKTQTKKTFFFNQKKNLYRWQFENIISHKYKYYKFEKNNYKFFRKTYLF